MNWKNIYYSILIIAVGMTPAIGFAQSEETSDEKKVEKKVIIVKKTIDADGNEKVEKIIKTGDEAENLLIEEKVEVNVEEADGQKIIRVRKGDGQTEEIILEEMDSDDSPMRIRILKDGEEFNWQGQGINEDVRKELEGMDLDFDFDFDFDSFEGGHMIMIDDEESDRPVMGVHIENAGGNGVLVKEVIEGSGADKAGLQVGDLITKVGKEKVTNIEGLIKTLNQSEIGDKVRIKYLRDGKKKRAKVVLSAKQKVFKPKLPASCHQGYKYKYKNHFNHNDSKKKNRIVIIEKDGKSKAHQGTVVSPPDVNISALEIFPNPTPGKVNIMFTVEPKPTTVKILDMNGKVLYEESLENFDGHYAKELDLDTSSGGAILQIIQGDDIFSEKILGN